MKCPICGKSFRPEAVSSAMPFCSPRCKLIDTKRWLGEEYSVETVDPEALEKEALFWERADVRPPETN